MKFVKVKLNNYGLYKGEVEFDFSPRKNASEKRKVILFGGKNGAGKTTLLQILGTLDDVSKEEQPEIRIDGQSIVDFNERDLAKFRNQNLGFIFQFHQLLPEFTALENVCIPAFIKGVKKSEAETKAKQPCYQRISHKRCEHKHH